MSASYCLDTYALIEITKDNPAYRKFKELAIVVNDITLTEFYGVLLQKQNEATAEYWWRQFSTVSLPVSKLTLREAQKFKQENRKSNISFFDAVGYIFAQQNHLLFLTGDKEFAGRPGVEYVK